MKKRYLCFVLFFIPACSQTPDIHTVGELTFPATPHAGERIRLRFHKDSSLISDKNDFQVSLYYTVRDKIYANPLPTSNSGTFTDVSFILPDSAQSFALKFQNYHSLINAKYSYIFPVYGHDGKPVAGARAGLGLFFLETGSGLLNRPADKDSALALMQEDFAAHKDIKQRWMSTYLNTLLALKKNKAYKEIQAALQQLLSSDSIQDGDYATAYTLYIQMNMWGKADSMMEAGTQRFPKGEMAMQAASSHLSFLQSVDSMVAYYNHFKKRFPAGGIQSVSAGIEDKMLRNIAFRYKDLGDSAKYLSYMSQVRDPLQKARDYGFLAGILTKTDSNLSLADTLYKMTLSLVQQSIINPEKGKPIYQTDQDRKEEMQKIYARFADEYSTLLSKERKLKEALAYQKQAVIYLSAEDPSVNELYIQYLLDMKDYRTAQKQLEDFIIQGQTTAKSDAYLKPLYIRLNHSDQGYSAYRSMLKRKMEVNLKLKLKAKLAREILNEPAPDFTLPDLKGKEVSLSDLKGKVVILDFWATWCGPCKASFPGMKEIVNELKNDSNVVFFFVNTDEINYPRQRQKVISDFIIKNNYPFRVLLDQRKTGDSNQYMLTSDYGINGIPAKFIIDRQGNIRFKKIGFSGSTPAEIQEVRMMIKMAQVAEENT